MMMTSQTADTAPDGDRWPRPLPDRDHPVDTRQHRVPRLLVIIQSVIDDIGPDDRYNR